ncbi:energy transducer TonB [Algihabitans albus]|uniref:energy transducer TonB n=1 Tax=Algihabitans albus TaxID=2164067 RepID=UPI0013C2F115|nr:energy transducer TonB [Algihabitans albus]
MMRAALSSLPGGSGAMAIAITVSTVAHASLLGLFLLGASDPVAPPSAHVTVELFAVPAGAPGSAPSLESASAQRAAEAPVQQAELTAPPDPIEPETATEAATATPVPLEVAAVATAAEAELPPPTDPLAAEAVIAASQSPPPLPRRRPAAAQMPTPPITPPAEAEATPAPEASPPAATRRAVAVSDADGSAAAASAPGGPSQGAELRPGGNPAPTYPESARRQGQEGRVMLRVTVGRDGRTRAVRVLRSSGHDRLDRAAKEAVERWRFEPARRAGQPVEGLLDIPVTFRLNNV